MRKLQFIVFCTAALIITTSAFAQENGRREQSHNRNFQQSDKKEIPKKLSAEEIAKQQTDTMSKEVSLTEKQYKKIYKVYLGDAKAMESSTGQERNGSMGRSPMGGGRASMGQGGQSMRQGGQSMRQGGQSMRQGGQSMGQGGQSMRQGGQSMRQSGQSMGQEGQSMGEGRQSMQNRDNNNHLDLEKLAAKKDAKIKKILTTDQYVLWIGIEHEKERKEFWDMKPMTVQEKRIK